MIRKSVFSARGLILTWVTHCPSFLDLHLRPGAHLTLRARIANLTFLIVLHGALTLILTS